MVEMKNEVNKIESTKKNDVLAGAAKSVTFAIVSAPSVIAKSLMKWFFNSPAKFFRPYAVSPWNALNDMASSEGKTFGVRYLRDLYTTDGFKVVSNNFWPLFALNCLSGFLIFSTYSFSYKVINPSIGGVIPKHENIPNIKTTPRTEYWVPFFCGGFSGAILSLMLTPIHNIRSLVTPRDLLVNRHTGIFNYSLFLLKKLFNEHKDPILRTRILFRKLPDSLAREAVCYSLFFGTFENLCMFAERLSRSDNNDAEDLIPKTNLELLTSKIKTKFAPIFFAGALSGITYNLAYYPTQTYKVVISNYMGKPLEDFNAKITLRDLYHVIKTKGIGSFYAGVGSQLMRIVTPSAIGLFVYKITTEDMD